MSGALPTMGIIFDNLGLGQGCDGIPTFIPWMPNLCYNYRLGSVIIHSSPPHIIRWRPEHYLDRVTIEGHHGHGGRTWCHKKEDSPPTEKKGAILLPPAPPINYRP